MTQRKQTKKDIVLKLSISTLCAAAFIILVILLLTVDRAPSGETLTVVGLSSFNSAVFSLFGKSDTWYTLSKLLGYAEIASIAFFAMLGAYQWIRRKKLSLIDRELFALAALYVIMAVIYVIFELIVINCRPVFSDGTAEASFPSSHSLIAIFTTASAALEAGRRLQKKIAIPVIALCVTVGALTVIGRLLGGVHWATDIIGSLLLGGVFIPLYDVAALCLREKQNRNNLP